MHAVSVGVFTHAFCSQSHVLSLHTATPRLEFIGSPNLTLLFHLLLKREKQRSGLMAMTPEQRNSRIAQRMSQFQGKQLKVHVLKG